MTATIITVLGIIVPAVATIAVAVIEKNAAKERKSAKERDERMEKRAAIREKESRLSMKMIDATMQLSVVTANALTGGYNNGNVEHAKAAAEEAAAEYKAFLQDVTAHEVSK